MSPVLAAASLDLGTPISRTPYDVYLGPMYAVLQHLGSGQPPLPVVEQLVREGRSFRYIYKTEQPYVPQTPEVTETTKAGDCKAKSLWLASKMDTRKVRFVIGKAKLQSNMSHAWIIWESPEGWLILDATNYSRPLAPDRLSPAEFIPTFSYSSSGRFAHTVSGAARGAKDGDH